MQRSLAGSVFSFFYATVLLAQLPPPSQLVPADIPGVVKAGTKIELIKDGLMGADDLIAFPDGSVVFGEPNASRVLHLDGQNRITTLVEQTNESRGMTLDATGRLIAVQAKDGQTKVAVIYPRGSETLIADNFEGRSFSRPNEAPGDHSRDVLDARRLSEPRVCRTRQAHPLHRRPRSALQTPDTCTRIHWQSQVTNVFSRDDRCTTDYHSYFFLMAGIDWRRLRSPHKNLCCRSADRCGSACVPQFVS